MKTKKPETLKEVFDNHFKTKHTTMNKLDKLNELFDILKQEAKKGNVLITNISDDEGFKQPVYVIFAIKTESDEVKDQIYQNSYEFMINNL